MLRKLKASEVEFSLDVEQDDVPVRGNALCSGDDELDKQAEDEILTRLRWGDPWAWAQVTVTAMWNGFFGHAHLGGCSYRDAKEFCQPGGYYDDLCKEALDDLNDSIADHARRLQPLEVTSS
jgi:hypothetical protein